jgi:hypothetical protein
MHHVDEPNKKTVVGFLYIAGGLTLLLHTLGIFEKGFKAILVILSLLIIALGFIKSGLWAYLYEKFLRKG